MPGADRTRIDRLRRTIGKSFEAGAVYTRPASQAAAQRGALRGEENQSTTTGAGLAPPDAPSGRVSHTSGTSARKVQPANQNSSTVDSM